MFDKLKKFKQVAENVVQENLYKERCLPIPDQAINFLIEKNLNKVSEMSGYEIKELKLISNSEHLTLKGKTIAKGVDAKFSIKIKPLLPIWTSVNHKVRFRVLEKSLEIDRSRIWGLLASVALAMFGTITGEDYFSRKIRGISDEHDAIEIPLDNLDTRLDQVIKTMDLKKIVPCEGKVEAIVQLRAGGMVNILAENYR